MDLNSDSSSFLQQAIELAIDNVESGLGGPFAALVVEDDSVLAKGTNRVTTIHDPTAHAEITAIRTACKERGDFELDGCTLYSTCEPCPMCLGAIYWARLDRVVYAATRTDAAQAGFDDDHIHQEINKAPAHRRIPMEQGLEDEAQRPFETWLDYDERVEY
jgi:tRNA(Arg) A34 adenosine deaminase TadA